MKILVAVKHTVDYTMKVRVNADGSDIVRDHLKFAMNPFDEIALEEAMRLLEQGQATAVEVISIGDGCQETLRRALAFGATRAIQVPLADAEPYHVAQIIAAWVQRESYDVVLLGKQAIDNDCNQVGQILAEFLQWPQATFASKIETADETLTVTREVDSGLETIRVTLPAVVTTDLRLNEPRYLSLPNIMKAKAKPIESVTCEDLGVCCQPHVEILKMQAPAVINKDLKKIESIKELLSTLKEKHGVLS